MNAATSTSLKSLMASAAVVSGCTMLLQLLSVATQMVVAALFGAGVEMDAFLAASTLPNYVLTVLVGALTPVFVPVFVGYRSSGDVRQAWELARTVTALCAIVLTVLVGLGVLFASDILRVLTPGLAPETIRLGARIAAITWPAALATGVFSLLQGVYHGHERFTRPAVVSVLGTAFYLAATWFLASRVGVTGLAWAVSLSAFLQAFLLLPVLVTATARGGALFAWRHPGLREVLHLVYPMLFTNALVWFTPVLDRFLASQLGVGSISHLNYANKIVVLLASFIASGIATVVFPRMSARLAVGDVAEMRRTFSMGMRMMWLAVAPAIALGGVLARPAVSFLFERGAFGAEDTMQVALLLRVYLFALAGMALGNVTGRAMYALKSTRILAVLGGAQALAYLVYAPALVRRVGVVGLAAACAVFFTLACALHLMVIRFKTGRHGGRTLSSSFLRTAVAAAVSGLPAWGAARLLQEPLWQLVAGATAGLPTYLAVLLALRSPELKVLVGHLLSRSPRTA